MQGNLAPVVILADASQASHTMGMQGALMPGVGKEGGVIASEFLGQLGSDAPRSISGESFMQKTLAGCSEANFHHRKLASEHLPHYCNLRLHFLHR